MVANDFVLRFKAIDTGEDIYLLGSNIEDINVGDFILI